MDAHGYRLAGNSRTASTDYIPSLVGVDPQQVSPTARDPYFERIEITDRRITSLSVSRWVTYDSLPELVRDPILEVKGPGGNYYIPCTELVEIAAANQDDETFAMLSLLKLGRR